ncbi:hypothetical protein EMIHUDRAFT_433418 [Emiliania huxleyi CCMP1516]|uniref:Zn(2)-C6 fungal-type domain-containing protein n=2 Tax=Emiliania huxleyi TaxID=2903 RepID=A0A0D3KUV3_EMIH1|nr:hypothetical protein EMIHUDRAFT_433418 [Emiliania huxleyi CCMP1516]EOD39538.1 hypothetical protein EMIHUDRAFT_433418 [Emiliania huxleyi CCMP1516]|eukprot:XP_005791967.1 hypothetical protein EMIHUDRAFT_433418 [Emiliania huxleyi CCMP1516]
MGGGEVFACPRATALPVHPAEVPRGAPFVALPGAPGGAEGGVGMRPQGAVEEASYAAGEGSLQPATAVCPQMGLPMAVAPSMGAATAPAAYPGARAAMGDPRMGGVQQQALFRPMAVGMQWPVGMEAMGLLPDRQPAEESAGRKAKKWACMECHKAKAACEGDPCRRCVRLGKKCVPQERPPPGKRRRNNRGAPTGPVVVVQPRDRFAQAPGPVPVLAGPPMVGLPIGAVPGVGKPVGYSAPA